MGFFFCLPMAFSKFARFLLYLPMDRLLKKEAFQKAKKAKVEKAEFHLIYAFKIIELTKYILPYCKFKIY